jgi:microcystin-dependent protein
MNAAAAANSSEKSSMTRKLLLWGAMIAAAVAAVPAAQAQGANRYLGEIFIVAGSRCPQYTAEANGQTLFISENTMLFSLYGTAFGGNGATTFALPDMRGRDAIGVGSGAFGNNAVGDYGGSDGVSLTEAQLGPHSHPNVDMVASDQAGTTGDPAGASLATFPPNTLKPYDNEHPNPVKIVQMAPHSIGVQATGGGESIPLRGPYLVVRYCVVTNGIMPQRPQ